MLISEIKPNPNNPRFIKDLAFEKLCKSIQEFPKMMELRPIIIDSNNMVLGGNMRLKALQHLKFIDIPDTWVRKADTLTEEEKQRFIIADNVSGGVWDWDRIANEWDEQELVDWGLSIPQFYGLDDNDFITDKPNSELEKTDNSEKIKCPSCGYEFKK